MDVAGFKNQAVLIVGASFAGLSTAFWMQRLGYAVTIVEAAPGIRTGGTPVNIQGDTIAIVQRMGLFERIRQQSLPVRPVTFVQHDGSLAGLMPAERDSQAPPEYEIERDELLHMLFAAVQPHVHVRFGDTVTAIHDTGHAVHVQFQSGDARDFALVFGCDGNHSLVRRLCFGPEHAYSHFLQHYFSIAIAPTLLIDEDTTQIYNTPGKTIMLSAYHGKTDICFAYFAQHEQTYDYRDTAQQRRIIQQQFAAEGWRTPELLARARQAGNFYFDKLCQIRMSSWSTGRIALVGDAGYCPSPAAGLGGSLAIIGAAALADAFAQHPADHTAAFRHYHANLSPFVDQVQADAVNFGLATFAPTTEQAIAERNARLQQL